MGVISSGSGNLGNGFVMGVGFHRKMVRKLFQKGKIKPPIPPKILEVSIQGRGYEPMGLLHIGE